MSRSSRWLILPLLILALGVATLSSAAPEPPSAATFLATLSNNPPPCLAGSQASVATPEIPLQVPEPEPRVIYPDCGVFCSDPSCSGLRARDLCQTGTGATGRCTAVNQVCTGEALHSPCFCR